MRIYKIESCARCPHNVVSISGYGCNKLNRLVLKDYPKIPNDCTLEGYDKHVNKDSIQLFVESTVSVINDYQHESSDFIANEIRNMFDNYDQSDRECHMDASAQSGVRENRFKISEVLQKITNP